MNEDQLTNHALKLLQSDPDYLADARIGAPLGNSIIGSVMNFTLKVPRQYTEQAVVRALAIIDKEQP